MLHKNNSQGILSTPFFNPFGHIHNFFFSSLRYPLPWYNTTNIERWLSCNNYTPLSIIGPFYKNSPICLPSVWKPLITHYKTESMLVLIKIISDFFFHLFIVVTPVPSSSIKTPPLSSHQKDVENTWPVFNQKTTCAFCFRLIATPDSQKAINSFQKL